MSNKINECNVPKQTKPQCLEMKFYVADLLQKFYD